MTAKRKPISDAVKRLLVWDTETTGLTLHPSAKAHLQPRMIEFGGAFLSLETGEVIERFSKLIHPGGPIPAEITKITGITDADVVHEGSFEERLPFLTQTFGRAHVMVSHNLPFDTAILRGDLARRGFDIKAFPWPKLAFCTVGLFQSEYGYAPKLTKLYEDKVGKPLAQTHRALDDVDALVEIIQVTEIWRMMK